MQVGKCGLLLEIGFRGSSIRVIARRIAYETHLEAFVGTHDLPLQPRTIDKRDDDVMADEVMKDCMRPKF